VRSRRVSVAAVALLTAIGGLGWPAQASSASSVATVVSTDATNYLIDAQHSGTATAVPTNAKQLWKLDLGGELTYPLIVGNVVYELVADVQTPTDLYGGHLLALDLRTGKTIWGPVHLNDGVYIAGLAYDNGRLFLATPASSLLRSFSAATGALLWSVVSPISSGDPPTTYAGVLYVSGYGPGSGSRVDCGGRMLAVNESNGATLWIAGSTVSYYCGIGSAPTVGPPGVFVYSATQVYGFSSTGQNLWHNLGPSYGATHNQTPALRGTTLWIRDGDNYATAGGGILSTATGVLKRSYSSGESPVFAVNKVFCVTTGPPNSPFAGDLTASSASTGTFAWRQGHTAYSGYNQPLVAGAVVYTVFTQAILPTAAVEGFDVHTGKLVWSAPVNQATYSPGYEVMAAAHGVLVVPIHHVLYAFG
jgi:hypothetical protein